MNTTDKLILVAQETALMKAHIEIMDVLNRMLEVNRAEQAKLEADNE